MLKQNVWNVKWVVSDDLFLANWALITCHQEGLIKYSISEELFSNMCFSSTSISSIKILVLGVFICKDCVSSQHILSTKYCWMSNANNMTHQTHPAVPEVIHIRFSPGWFVNNKCGLIPQVAEILSCSSSYDSSLWLLLLILIFPLYFRQIIQNNNYCLVR